jgi:hypothetical protein
MVIQAGDAVSLAPDHADAWSSDNADIAGFEASEKRFCSFIPAV